MVKMFPQRNFGYLKLTYSFVFLVFQQFTNIVNSLDISNGLFANCDFYFVAFYYSNYAKPLDIPEYFDKIITTQPTTYVPVTLMINLGGSITTQWATLSSKGWSPLNNRQIQQQPTRTRIIFFHVESGENIYGVREFTALLNPEFIFVHLLNLYDTSSYKNYVMYSGNSKPIIWNTDIPNSLFIPCLTCNDNAVVIKENSLTSIPDIRRIWYSHNLMAKYIC
jgi:hypothetical protein